MGTRQNRLEIVPVSELPDFHQFDFARLGSFSTSTKTHKFVLEGDLYEYNNEVNTVPFHFRNIISSLDIPRHREPIQPTYAYSSYPSKWPNVRYYDVKQAYLQIARGFGANTFLEEGKTCHYGDYRFRDSLFSNSRVARGLLVSGTQQKQSFDIWENGKIDTVSFPNSLYSPHLRAAIQMTLHSIMFMLKRYAIYVNTDGLIVPAMYYKRVEAFFDNWNIKYSIKFEGDGEVVTRGTYRIGSHKTATYGKWPQKTTDYIIESKPLWWLNKWRKGMDMLE